MQNSIFQNSCTASRVDKDGYFMGDTLIQEDPENKGKFLLPPDTVLVEPPMPYNPAMRYKLVKKGRRTTWLAELKPEPVQQSPEYEIEPEDMPEAGVEFKGFRFDASYERWLVLCEVEKRYTSKVKTFSVLDTEGVGRDFTIDEVSELISVLGTELFEKDGKFVC